MRLGEANAHVWAEIFEWVCATAFDCDAAAALRGTCRLGVTGFDVAVHSGAVAVAAAHPPAHDLLHGGDCGAPSPLPTSWFPLRLPLCGGPDGSPPAGRGPAPFPLVRLEHCHVSPAAGASVRQWAADAVVLCCVRWRRSAVGAIDGDEPARVALAGGFIAQGAVASLRFASIPANVTALPYDVLAQRPSLRRVHLSGLAKVEHPGQGFLEATAIEALDLSPMVSLTRLPGHFCLGCTALRSFRTAGLDAAGRLTKIGDGCLMRCSSLTELDASGFAHVTRVGAYFAGSCSALTAFDLSAFQSLEAAGDGFFSGCAALRALRGRAPRLRRIGAEAFERSGLQAFDARCIPAVEVLGAGFLSLCRDLVSMNTTGLEGVSVVPDCFIAGGQALKEIDTVGLAPATSIGFGFLRHARRLEVCDLVPLLQNVDRVGLEFLKGAPIEFEAAEAWRQAQASAS